MTKELLTENLSAPLNGATSARIDIHAGDSNLTIDQLTSSEPVLASGTLQYFEGQSPPAPEQASNNGETTFTLKGSPARRPWFHLPWEACNGATEWQIHLNPSVSADLTAHTDGGNVRLDLAGMDVTRVSADTGGGNLDVILPDNTADLNVTARTGAGNVTIELGSGISGSHSISADSGAGNVVVCIPGGIAARIHTATGLGKAIVDPQFSQTGKNTYQSSGFESAADKVEINMHSGAGNVIVNAR